MTPAKFNEINWNAPFDFKKYLSVVPVDATVKSIFVRDVVGQVQRRGGTIPFKEEYLSAKECPLRAYMSMLFDASKVLYPNVPMRAAIRELGRSVFPTFVESLLGRVILGVMGSDVVGIMKLSNKAAAATISTGHVATIMAAPGEAILHLKDVYLSDTYQIGVFEGMLAATHKQGAKVLLNTYSINDVYMQITWQDQKP